MSKKSEDYRRRQQRVQAFRDGLVGLLNLCEPVEDWLGNARWGPRPGNEAEAQRRVSDLERLTQPAAIAVQQVGATVDLKAAGTNVYRPANPVLLWSTLFDRPVIDANLIIGSCERAIGAFDAAAEDAEAHEATAAGRIESRLDGPRGIWRAVRGAREHRSVFWSGVAVAVVGGLIVAGIAHWLGWV